ncbi:MAG: 4-alpha-glucanotransferase [Propionibacteriaceae bacterium]|jgi:4-alpha-glucanotransferase|nr:4-alpha-glucanotransferase [Propionibacteriaceae bacterium]
MSNLDPRLAQLADLYGVSTEFWDWKGQHRRPSHETVVACLSALGVDVDAPDWMDRAFKVADERTWLRPLPTCVVVRTDQPSVVDVHVDAGSPAQVWVRLEDGVTETLSQIDNDVPDRLLDGRLIGRATFKLPDHLPCGYHRLFLSSDDHFWETSLIATPPWVGTPGLPQAPVWGLMTQLYSVCGESSWGLGDFTDLADLAVWAGATQQADYVLTNPLHAAEVTAPMEPSPYFPVTRRYINPIYLRPEAIEEYAVAPQVTRDIVADCRRQACEATLAGAGIDRDSVWAAKKTALLAIFEVRRRIPRQMEFDAYVAREGEPLRRHATWCALSEEHGSRWRAWPEDLQDPTSQAVADFVFRHSGRVAFYMWLQWLCDLQARHAQVTAVNAGMRLGVMSDLAVGINAEGEEIWADADMFSAGVTVGAPPDAYNQSGQDWRQPPWRPDQLEQSAYRPFREMVAAIMHNCGGLRVDHIIGLFRLWWIPRGMDPTQGIYVRYNHEALVGILALEAYRAGATIIGEDLGTVEPWVRQYLAGRGILGTSILWFESDDDGRPLQPEQWRGLCLASVTTHDLPPTLGYLAHDHVALRYRLGLLTESLEDEIGRDAAEQGSVLHLLEARGLIQAGEHDPHTIMLALYRFLYQTPSKLKCVALTDMVGERRIQNQPGTINEYPNWRVPLADEAGRRLTLEQIYSLTSINAIPDILNGKV